MSHRSVASESARQKSRPVSGDDEMRRLRAVGEIRLVICDRVDAISADRRRQRRPSSRRRIKIVAAFQAPHFNPGSCNRSSISLHVAGAIPKMSPGFALRANSSLGTGCAPRCDKTSLGSESASLISANGFDRWSSGSVSRSRSRSRSNREETTSAVSCTLTAAASVETS